MINDWFRGDYDEFFLDYTDSVENPFELIRSEERIEGLLKIFSQSEEQFSLFPQESSLITLLREVDFLNESGKFLWRRFRYNTSGKIRNLSVPGPVLKSFFDKYFNDFIKSHSVHLSCHGAEKGWSVSKSLGFHLPLNSALSFDLSSAFENVEERHIFGFFFDRSEELSDPSISYETRRDISGFLTFLSTVSYSGSRGLPQGSSHANFLFNRVLYPLDSRIFKEASLRGMRYSRWVDDFTISSDSSSDFSDFLGAMEVVHEHFPFSRGKSFFQTNPNLYNGESNLDNGEGIYLLGHRINGKEIFKNTKEKKENNKKGGFDYDELIEKNYPYESWLDEE